MALLPSVIKGLFQKSQESAFVGPSPDFGLVRLPLYGIIHTICWGPASSHVPNRPDHYFLSSYYLVARRASSPCSPTSFISQQSAVYLFNSSSMVNMPQKLGFADFLVPDLQQSLVTPFSVSLCAPLHIPPAHKGL